MNFLGALSREQLYESVYPKVDAIIVFSPSTALADAAATAIGNRVRIPEDIPAALEFAQGIKGLQGVAIIKGDDMGLWGQIKLAAAD